MERLSAPNATAAPNEESYDHPTRTTAQEHHSDHGAKTPWHRDTYFGALGFSVVAFLLPALYAALSKFWVANIDSWLVVTTDVYGYLSNITEVLNEGLPRAAWVVISDKSSRTYRQRLGLFYTLVAFQALFGFLLSIAITYVRLSAFSALGSAIEVAVSISTRALDLPDVPGIISSVKFAVNIVLDLLIISRFHVGNHQPTVNDQARIQLTCNLVSGFAGLAYFLIKTLRSRDADIAASSNVDNEPKLRPNLAGLRIFIRPGLHPFVESLVRNALYLWLTAGIVKLEALYTTAWGIFNTIRWGLVMVPIMALEATSPTYVGHFLGYASSRCWPFQLTSHSQSCRPTQHRTPCLPRHWTGTAFRSTCCTSLEHRWMSTMCALA